MGAPDLPGEGEIWGSNPQPTHAIANCCSRMANNNEKRFRLYQITLVLVTFRLRGLTCVCNAAIDTTPQPSCSHRPLRYLQRLIGLKNKTIWSIKLLLLRLTTTTHLYMTDSRHTAIRTCHETTRCERCTCICYNFTANLQCKLLNSFSSAVKFTEIQPLS